jgi:hypothetical protein
VTAEDLGEQLGDAATGRLHLVVHDYTTFAGAEELVATMEERLGSVDDVVAPIGGWWAAGHGTPGQVTADQVGSVAVAAAASAVNGREIRLRDQAELAQALALLHGTRPAPDAKKALSA